MKIINSLNEYSFHVIMSCVVPVDGALPDENRFKTTLSTLSQRGGSFQPRMLELSKLFFRSSFKLERNPELFLVPVLT